MEGKGKTGLPGASEGHGRMWAWEEAKENREVGGARKSQDTSACPDCEVQSVSFLPTSSMLLYFAFKTGITWYEWYIHGNNSNFIFLK